MTAVTTWFLQMSAPEELLAADDPGTLDIVEARIKQYQFNRFLYQLVGETWQWTDKLGWSDSQWRSYAEADDLRTWVAWCEGSPAGYFELQKQENGTVEICYFGLTEKFIGRGLGGFLLTETIRQAWNWDASRVSVNTCSLDHPGALHNYEVRGLKIYRTDVSSR